MIPVLDSRGMRAADRAAIAAGVPSLDLMENAAAALADRLLAAWPSSRRVVVVCGPGNNGGDGLAAARRLAAADLAVSVFTLREPEAYRGDAAESASRVRQAGIALTPLSAQRAWKELSRTLSESDVVVDALFGTGLSRGLEGAAARAVRAVNASGKPVLSADLPSGLSADTGALLGVCVRAEATVAFAAAKRCHVLPPARAFCGDVTVAPIGIAPAILAARPPALEITQAADVAALLPPRKADSHKGDYGRLAILAGSRGKAGAAALAARGALRAGAGLVTVFCPASLEGLIVTVLPEAMTRGLPEEDGRLSERAAPVLEKALSDFDAVACGPGLSIGQGVAKVLERLLASSLPVVCDADALNTFAGRPRAFRRRVPTILTPHPGEAGRLLGKATRSIQADRLGAVTALARQSGAIAVLKGSGTLIAAPGSPVVVNPTGTPLMATAGAGDVLTGAAGALLASGMPARLAAIAAAYLHGAAGEHLAATLGDAGLLASELADAIPPVRRLLEANAAGAHSRG